jgi:4-hydroxy-tetrahydrodipicolinate synthase
VVPEATRKLFDLTIAGNWKEARALQMRLTELFDLIVFGVNFPEGVRAAIEMRGFHLGDSRQPGDVTQFLDKTKIEQTIERLLSDR